MLLTALLTLLLLADPADQILQQAIALHQSGDIPAAIESYKKYLASHPDSLIALSNLGAAYAKTAHYEEAIAQYKHALAVQPGNLPVELNLGLAYYKTGRTEAAAATLEKVHAAGPGQLQPTLLLADCWLAMGRNKDVVELLTPLSAQKSAAEPDALAITYLLGTALVRDNQVERGQLVIDRILRNGDSAEARLLLGTTKLSARDFPAALADLTKAVQLNPALPDVYTYYGQALLRTGDAAGAAEAFRKALAANPNDFDSNLQLAVLLKEDARFDEALTLVERALLARPSDLAARYQLATIELQQSKLDDARIQLESITKSAPGFTEAHVTLATVYYRLKRKPDGDRERALVLKLNAATQAGQQQGINVK